MTTGFTGTFTLNSPLTDDDWDKITDVDFDNTHAITFHTKHGKEVEVVKAMRWIPVTERLPDNDNKVLCCTVTAKGLRNVIIGYYADRWCCGMNSNVIAWQPLPEPYKDGD